MNELSKYDNSTEFKKNALLNFMFNFASNQNKTFHPKDPPWFNGYIKNLLRRQKHLFKKYKKNGFTDTDNNSLDRHRSLSASDLFTSIRYFFLQKFEICRFTILLIRMCLRVFICLVWNRNMSEQIAGWAKYRISKSVRVLI